MTPAAPKPKALAAAAESGFEPEPLVPLVPLTAVPLTALFSKGAAVAPA